MNTQSSETIGKLAIVGMSCRFPGCRTPQEYWKNLHDGKESITFFSPEELASRGVSQEELDDPNFVSAAGVYEGTYLFDAPLFSYTPREAELLDPQQRVFLECCWEALENAGYPPLSYPGNIGLFAGAGPSNHLWRLFNEPSILNSAGWLTIMSSNERDFLATRVGYKLNLRGPCVTVQTACSTSLVATILACQSLLTYQSDIALAGGVTLDPDETSGYTYQEGGITSPDGHNQTFDAAAKGTVFSNGVGVVALKRLSDAIADRDTIHAVVIGYGMKNDGSAKVGYTAPSVEGQAATAAQALAMAGVNPETISYVECHGTATPVGDPIEISALAKAFRQYTDKKHFCKVGSVKSNIGHTDSAAGVAGLIKTVLCLENEAIPPTLHYKKPNPQIDFDSSPFYVNDTLSDWKRNGVPRRAGLNSFGIGGTNAHVILEEAPIAPASGISRPTQLLVLSAKDDGALNSMNQRLADYLVANGDVPLADVAYTLQTGRSQLQDGRALVCRDREDAISLLRGENPARIMTKVNDQREASTVFLFPGQGTQYIGMAKQLYESEPVFRQQFDLCASYLASHASFDLTELLYANGDPERRTRSLEQTEFTQPALFVIEYALAKLWMSWGIQPAAMAGHSVGEYVAACLAGVFSLEDALKLVASRAKLMQSMAKGAMLSVLMKEEDLRALLLAYPDVSLAAVNSSDGCVVSGTISDIDRLEADFKARAVPCSRLHTSHAFHSSMMDPILEPFRQLVKSVRLSMPVIPYASNLTGEWIQGAEATDPDYWVKHLRSTVRFAQNLSTILTQPKRILLEVGPGRTLSSLALRHPRKEAIATVTPSLPGPKDQDVSDLEIILTAVGKLWLEGVPLNWAGFYSQEQRNRVALPTYPFQHQTYQIAVSPATKAAVSGQPLEIRKKTNVDEWFYSPSWKRSAPVQAGYPITGSKPWILFVDDQPFSTLLTSRLREIGHDVTTVAAGSIFTNQGGNHCVIDPRDREHYTQLLAPFKKDGATQANIVHLWSLSLATADTTLEEVNIAIERGFDSLLLLAQAIGPPQSDEVVQLFIVGNGVHDVTDGQPISPAKALVLGPAKVIPIEYPNIKTRCIDLDLDLDNAMDSSTRAVDQLLREMNNEAEETIVAYRGVHRWVQDFDALTVKAPDVDTKLKKQGVYLITGGLGGIGLVFAEYLAVGHQARLVLFGRSSLPDKEKWTQWLESHDTGEATSRKIRTVQRLEEAGAEVLVLTADVSDRKQMEDVVAKAKEKFGSLDGVIHSAGVAGSSVIELKTLESTRQILDPKVRGTIILDSVLSGERLDFFLLCSSLSVFFPAAGQVDYVAGNAFLDAFSHSRQKRLYNVPISVNWDQWNEVGMAVATDSPNDKPPTPDGSDEIIETDEKHDFHNNVFSSWCQKGDSRVFCGELEPRKHWILGDHLLSGIPTLVGTAYIDLVRAAAVEYFGTDQLELRDLAFLTPLMVEKEDRRQVELVLSPSGAMCDFEFRSRTRKAPWVAHAVGRIGKLKDSPSRERCTIGEISDHVKGGSPESISGGPNDLVQSGPRWDNLVVAKEGTGEGWSILRLEDTFIPDLTLYPVHPALLDRAVGFAGNWVSALPGAYLPYSYEKVLLLRPLTQTVYCHARFSADASALSNFFSVDVSVFDQEGQLAVEIKGFTLKRVEGKKLEEWNTGQPLVEPSLITKTAPAAPKASMHSDEVGIRSSEGVEAFRRILTLNSTPQIIAASVDIRMLALAMKTVEQPTEANDGQAPASSAVAHARPNVSTPYLAPRTELEESIAEIWQAVLGISGIGVYDNFAELGGHSLMAIQLTSRIREMFEIELPVAKFYRNPTIMGVAETIVEVLTSESDAETIEKALQGIQAA